MNTVPKAELETCFGHIYRCHIRFADRQNQNEARQGSSLDAVSLHRQQPDADHDLCSSYRMGYVAKYAYFFITCTLLNAVFYTANNIAYSAGVMHQYVALYVSLAADASQSFDYNSAVKADS